MKQELKNWGLNLPTSNQIYWIAGLLEGEGYFRIGATSVQIGIEMSDLDIIDRFRAITKTGNSKITIKAKEGLKTTYTTNIYGDLAIQWMMTLYSLMGVRRKAKFKEIIDKWKHPTYMKDRSSEHNDTVAKKKAVEALMLYRNMSFDEAVKFVDESRDSKLTTH